MFKRILVVLDPAKDMSSARRYAIEIVKRWDSSVVALYTAFEEAIPFKAAYAEGIKPKMFLGKRIVEEFEKELLAEVGKDVDLTSVVEEGPYEVAIPSVAAREDVDLVVLGSFHPRVERAIIGSDTERVIEYSPCSVMLVRDRTELPPEGSTIAFAHDSSKITPQAVASLTMLSSDLKARVQPILGTPPRGLDDGRKTANKLVDTLNRAGIETIPPQVLTSRWILGPHAVVHRAVSGEHPNMVVISRFAQMTEGNGTHWLVHEFVVDTPCPMLIMK